MFFDFDCNWETYYNQFNLVGLNMRGISVIFCMVAPVQNGGND
jgi:hypothetical protein